MEFHNITASTLNKHDVIFANLYWFIVYSDDIMLKKCQILSSRTYPSINSTRPVYKYKTGCQFFHQGLPKICENTRFWTIFENGLPKNQKFETSLVFICGSCTLNWRVFKLTTIYIELISILFLSQFPFFFKILWTSYSSCSYLITIRRS